MKEDNTINVNQQEDCKKLIDTLNSHQQNIHDYFCERFKKRNKKVEFYKKISFIPYFILSISLWMWASHSLGGSPTINHFPFFLMGIFSAYGILNMIYKIIEIIL